MYYHNPIVLTSGEIPQVTVVEVTVASELKLPINDITTAITFVTTFLLLSNDNVIVIKSRNYCRLNHKFFVNDPYLCR